MTTAAADRDRIAPAGSQHTADPKRSTPFVDTDGFPQCYNAQIAVDGKQLIVAYP